MTVVTPSSPEEMAEVLRRASAEGRAIDVAGGGTRSRRGRPGPRAGDAVSTAGLDRVIAHEPADLTLTAEAGIAAAEVARIAATGGQCWPQADVRDGSTLGGVLAAAASGRERLRAGAVRDSLLDLLKHPERLFDPSAQINADIQRIATQMPAMFDRIATEVTQEALAQLNQGTALVQQLQESASSAKAVTDSMQKLQGSKLQSDLDELNGLLPKQAAVAVAPAPGVAVRPIMVTLSPSVTLANKQRLSGVLLKADPAKLPIVVQQKATAGDLSQKWQAIQLKQKTAVQVEQVQVQKVDKDLGQMFVGKKGADADKKKKELLEEAKKRFASDPKTLAKVQQYIEAHAPKG